MTIRLSLNNRIIAFMITSSLLLIGLFTLIQLKNAQDNLIRFNSYRANLSSIIVRNNLGAIIKQRQPEELGAYLQNGLNVLTETGIIQDGYVFNKDGVIIASVQKQLIGQTTHYKDLKKWLELESIEEQNKFFLPETDNLKRQLYMYMPLKKDLREPIAYVTKVTFSLENIQQVILGVYRPVILTTMLIILANILLGYLLYKKVIGPVKMLNRVTKIIAQGDLSIRTNIATGDELEELGLNVNYMAEELIKMKVRAENANPLTKLPGNIVIREEIERRIKENMKFAVIYCDINKFKAFNDKYGIARGDDVIKLVADISKKAIKTKGNPDDFIGHEGGDDFILLTTLDKAQTIADAVIQEFDKQVVNLYDPEDLNRGYIISQSRDGSITRFPIMGVSLAGVTNAHRAITSYAEVTNIAAEMKRKVKSIETSVFAMDQRRDSAKSGTDSQRGV